jgi:hypothetical protein
VTLGKALEVSEVAVEIGAAGRAVVAWATRDTGLRVDFANRLRAAFRERGERFGPAQLVHVGHAVDPDDGQPLGLRLAVAPAEGSRRPAPSGRAGSG